MKQADLFVEGLTLNVGPVPLAARPRLSRQALAILARLERGPVTNTELASMALQYNARIYDLRANGYEVECYDKDHTTGAAWYRLVK